MDKQGRDQFAVRYQDQTEICWNDARRGLAEDVYKVRRSARPPEMAPLHNRCVFVRLCRPTDQYIYC
eukprot:scaffold309295_cov24-Prasinocladus_malaysianus.AAC.1